MIELLKEEKKCIQELCNEKNNDIKKKLFSKLLKIKKEILYTIKNKTCNENVAELCESIFSNKKKILLEKYEYFSNLYEYLKEKQDTDEIKDILLNIEYELSRI